MMCLFSIFLYIYIYSSLVLDAQLYSLYTRNRLILSPMCPWLWQVCSECPYIVAWNTYYDTDSRVFLSRSQWFQWVTIAAPRVVDTASLRKYGIFLFLILRKFFLRPEGWFNNFDMTFRLMTKGTQMSPFPGVFRFSVITGPSTFLWASHLWVGRRQKPIFGCDDRNWFLRG